MRNDGGRRGAAKADAPSKGGEAAEAAIPVVVVGLGELGVRVVASALQHPELSLVGVADPERAGRRLAESIPGAPDLVIERSAEGLYRKAKGGAALICGGSLLDEVAPEIRSAVRAGLHVVSSCEELVHPWFVDPELAEDLDRLARKSGVAILGTGWNPGFMLDRLVVTLGAVMGEVRHVEASLKESVSGNAHPLWRKIGAGLTLDEFEKGIEEGSIGHVGLAESCGLVVDGLALDVEEIEEEIDAIVAEREVVAGDRSIPAGRVRGIRQVARGIEEGREVVRLELELAVELDSAGGRIRIEGDPPLELTIPGRIESERAAAWSIVNAVPRVAAAESGIIEVLDLPAGR